VGPQVRLGPHATLLPHVVLYTGVQAGSYFFAHAHAVVREYCVLGDHVTLENGVVIGADGFGFAKNEQGRWEKIPQSGPVRIGNRVDVQANATIDRATVGETRIGDGTKIDNLVQVGHNVTIGEHSILCAQVGIAGSAKLGNYNVLAGQVGIAGHLKLGDRVTVASKSGVMHAIPDGETWLGIPAQPDRQAKRMLIAMQRLPDLLKKVAEWERKLKGQD